MGSIVPLLLGLILFAPMPVFGQALGDTEPITVTADPLYPAPYSQSVLTVLSSAVDLANATMNVTVDGKPFYKGVVKATSVPLGAAGNVATVRVTITSKIGTYSKTVSLRPQDVTLITEPMATAPSLYPGKPLPPLEGTVRVVAMAGLRAAENGKMVSPESLSYAWTVDGAKQADISGIGKNTIIVATPLQYRSRPISVVVQSQDGSLVGGASMDLAGYEPVIRLYENDPLLGIRFERALVSSYKLLDAEASLYAAHYSFPKLTSTLSTNWYLNGEFAQSGPTITLRPTGKGRGDASLSIVSTLGELVRTTSALRLSFGETATNFFGL